MRKKLLDILACPIDKYYPLELIEFSVKDDVIVDGVLICNKCNRYYPIIDEIPEMLPDELRTKERELDFLNRWKEKLPEKVIYEGKPFNLKV